MLIFPDKKVYIGMTCRKRLTTRWRNGEGYNTQIRMYNAIKECGWENIRHKIIANNLTQEQAAALEIESIAKYDSTNLEKGYNISTGGLCPFSGVILSQETRAKIGMAHRGKHLTEEQKRHLSEINIGERNPNWGLRRSEETKRKISQANKGRKPTPEVLKKLSESHMGQIPANAKKVKCIETGITYDSCQHAGKALNICGVNIGTVCRGKRKTAGGYHFIYV